MKYKVGDEVLVKAKLIGCASSESSERCMLKVDRTELFTDAEGILPVPQMTAEEAWDIAKNLFADYSNSELDEIFGKGWSFPKLMELTPQEAKAKIEEWETEKEIKVGDVVNVCGDIGVVTSFGTDGNSIHVIYSDGIVNSYRKDKDIKKTGSHIDIDWFLKQIGGDE